MMAGLLFSVLFCIISLALAKKEHIKNQGPLGNAEDPDDEAGTPYLNRSPFDVPTDREAQKAWTPEQRAEADTHIATLEREEHRKEIAEQKRKEAKKEKVVVWKATDLGDVYIEPLRDRLVLVRSGVNIDEVENYDTEDATYIPPFGKSLLEEAVLTLADGIEAPGEEKDLLEDIYNFIGKWVVLDRVGEKGDVDDSRRKLLAYYILSTWRYERARSLPEMRVLGPPEVGKSRALKVCSILSYNCVYIKSGTPAAIFRTVNMTRGSLALDEVDFSKVHPDVIDVLLHRYEANSPLIRCHPVTFEPEAFELFGPTFLSAYYPSEHEALESRTFDIDMEESMEAPPDLTDEFYEEAASLRRRLMGWRLEGRLIPDHEVDYDRLKGLTPRLRQLGGSLLLCVGPAAFDFVYSFMRRRRVELVEARAAMPQGKAALALLSLLEPPQNNDTPLVSEVAYQIHLNEGLTDEDKMENPRQVGPWLDALGVRRKRTTRGYRCILDPTKIEELRRRYDVDYIPEDGTQKRADDYPDMGDENDGEE